LGLSQYGAYGLANLGKKYPEILGHYYQRTKISNLDTRNTNIRIGIVLGGSGGRIWVRGGTAKINQLVLAPDSAIDISLAEIKVTDKDNKEIAKMPFDNIFSLDSQVPQTFFEVTYKSSLFNKYKGSLVFSKNSSSIITVNQLNLEEYLKGVVPAEMSPGRPLEALKAQACAARSYAMKHLNPAAAYDMDDSTSYQVYIGFVDYESTNRAVSGTAGQVIMYGAEIISAYYHSTSGGYTENNENVWGGNPIAWLRGVESPWETDSPYWGWSSRKYNRFELANIFNRFPETRIGDLVSIEIINRGISGRVLAIKITGTDGQKYVSGQTFKNLINNSASPTDPQLRSTLFGLRP
jgi:stage II sporulation protein D